MRESEKEVGEEMEGKEVSVTIDQLTLEVKFYLNQTAQNIIEVGKRLTQAKAMLRHGEWQNWLKDNFNLNKSTANNFMRCAERFSNFQTSGNLNPSQMVEMLALPAGEEEKFIEQKAAGIKKGKRPVSDDNKQKKCAMAEYILGEEIMKGMEQNLKYFRIEANVVEIATKLKNSFYPPTPLLVGACYE